MTDPGAPRPRGRPRKHTTKRSAFNTRIRQELKARLETAAAEAGRSLSEEIEFRLENSFIQAEQSELLRNTEKKLAMFQAILGKVAEQVDILVIGGAPKKGDDQ